MRSFFLAKCFLADSCRTSVLLALDALDEPDEEGKHADCTALVVSVRERERAEFMLMKSDRIYELAATLLAHALCLSNQASVLVATLGSYETSASVTTAALKIHDETVNTAAELLCRASGVLTHLSQVVIPEWEAVARERIKGRPLELSRDVVYALARYVPRPLSDA